VPLLAGLSLAAPPPADVLELITGPARCGDVLWQDGELHITGDDESWLTLGASERAHPIPDAQQGALLSGPGGPLWLSLRSGAVYGPGSDAPLTSLGATVQTPVVLGEQVWALSSGGLVGQSLSGGARSEGMFPGAVALATDSDALWLVTPNPRGDGILHRWRPEESGLLQTTPIREASPTALVAMRLGGVAIAGTHLSRRDLSGRRRWSHPTDKPILQLLDAGDRLLALSTDRLQIFGDDDGQLLAEAPLRGACAASLHDDRLFIRDHGGVSEHDPRDGRLLQRQHTTQRPAHVVADPKTGDRFILDADGGEIYVWSPTQPMSTLPGAQRPIALSRERGVLVALDLSGELMVWDVVSRELLQRIVLGSGGHGVLAHDEERSIVSVLYPGELVAAALSGEVLWRRAAPEEGTIAAGGGRVYIWDAAANQVAAHDAQTGAPLARVALPAPPRRSRSVRERALFFDPRTDRLFCGRDILDGRDLSLIGHIDGVDQIVHADERIIVARRAGRDGTASAILLDAAALTPILRTPLAQLLGSDGELSYDPDARQLFLSEAGRGRVIAWSYPR
jgi:outer membrane protein assembly factor BamB